MFTALTIVATSILAPPPPGAPPVYGPCPAHNPLTEYQLWVSGAWDQNCYNIYVGTYLNAITVYWNQIAACPPGDCACYAWAWQGFLAEMDAAEDALRVCSPT